LAGVAAFADLFRRGSGNDAQGGFSPRQRVLDIEHPLQPGGVCHDRAHRSRWKISGPSRLEGRSGLVIADVVA
jgi:hypothetical protein